MGAIQSVLAWWPGDDTNYVVLGFSVKTWGRIGKLMQYIGGLVALIDILGEQRFRQASERIRRSAGSTRRFNLMVALPAGVVVLLLLAALASLVFAIVRTVELSRESASAVQQFVLSTASLVPLLLCIGVLASPQIVSVALVWLARLSASPLNMKAVGFLLVTIGFALDFLAS